ncbi:hypothetical protein FGI60_02495 [Brucella haematophila]|nr:hypothetical protein FGI60_02495 [Brucella haematophila]
MWLREAVPPASISHNIGSGFRANYGLIKENLEHIPKSVKRFSEKMRVKNKTLERRSDSIRSAF